ncbi:MAG: hypothetical protein K6F69_02590 [Treponema sp.]|nr:hypothetical protein [Treponema sp.]
MEQETLLHEAFCLYSESEIFDPYEKHHSNVKDACEKAETLGIKNLLLYHTEEFAKCIDITGKNSQIIFLSCM